MANYQQFGGYGQRYDIKRLVTGDSFKICFQVTDGRVVPSVPFDFTYYQDVTFTISENNNSKELFSFAVGSGVTLTAGEIEVYVAAGSFAINAGQYFYTMKATDENGDVFTWLYGNFETFDEKGLSRNGGRTTPITTTIEICLPSACTVNLNIQ